jgi:hypothetical protein
MASFINLFSLSTLVSIELSNGSGALEMYGLSLGEIIAISTLSGIFYIIKTKTNSSAMFSDLRS